MTDMSMKLILFKNILLVKAISMKLTRSFAGNFQTSIQMVGCDIGFDFLSVTGCHQWYSISQNL